MASLPKKLNLLFFVSVSLIFLFFFGQLARINFPFFERSIPILDGGVIILSLLNFFLLKNNHGYLNFSLLFFLIYTLFRSLLTTPDLLSLAYLLRLYSFFVLLALPSATLDKNRLKIRSFFLLIILANAIFGLIQYFLWPDFTFFLSQGWDPHLHRLVSTFFDPTFTALIYLSGMQITHHQQNLPPLVKFFLYFVFFIALALTYSRAGIIIFVFLVWLNNKKFTYLALLLSIITILILPRPFGEGTKLERTSTLKARLTNYHQAFTLIQKNLAFGIGYNNLPSLKNKLHLNFQTSHSSSGFDSSLLTIFSTTGLIGFFLFLLGIKRHLQNTNPLNRNLTILILLHSFSANSLLYLWILLLLALV